MDRETRTILIVALVVIVLLFFLSGRGLPLLGGPATVDVDAPDIALVPTISPQVPDNDGDNDSFLGEEADADIEIDPDVTIDPNEELNPSVLPPSAVGPLLNLETPPGFVSGILHGLLSPIMLVLSLLLPNIRMYAFNNIGPRYDLGFLVGIFLLILITQVRRFRF